MADRPRDSERRDERALDALNFFLADVRDGVGPYLSSFLKTRRWDSSVIGLVMSATGIAKIAFQTPAGALIDRVRERRLIVVVAAILVSAGCASIAFFPNPMIVISAQMFTGMGAAVFPPAIAALSLGLVGRARFTRRTGRNEAFNHLGNVAAATLAGLLGWYVSFEAMFILVAVMGVGCVVSVLMIRERDIDPALARGADRIKTADGRETIRIAAIGELLKDRNLLAFATAIVLFHFSNAAMLPLVGQKIAKLYGDESNASAAAMSACVVAAQLVMIPVSLAAGRLARSWGRLPLLAIAFGILPIRGYLYTLTNTSAGLVAVQLLDGVGAGTLGVVGVLVIADLTRGTGRFNLMQGALSTVTDLGASLSHATTGIVVSKYGYDAGFLTLAAIALVAFLFLIATIGETRGQEESIDSTSKHN